MKGVTRTTRKLNYKTGEWDYAEEYFIDGEQVTLKTYKKHFPDKPIGPSGGQSTGWPMKSEALAVHPAQIGQAYERARQAGVTTEFTATGEPVFTSAAHRKRYCENVNAYDRNGGYSDPQVK